MSLQVTWREPEPNPGVAGFQSSDRSLGRRLRSNGATTEHRPECLTTKLPDQRQSATGSSSVSTTKGMLLPARQAPPSTGHPCAPCSGRADGRAHARSRSPRTLHVARGVSPRRPRLDGSLRVRVYNVRFGDAVSSPSRRTTARRRRVTSLWTSETCSVTKAARTRSSEPVVEDVIAELSGEPLDLYVMTHEHLDHVQGLLYTYTRLGLDIDTDRAWLTASAEPGYYTLHPKAKRKKLQAETAFRQASDTSAYLLLRGHALGASAQQQPPPHGRLRGVPPRARRFRADLCPPRAGARRQPPVSRRPSSSWGPEEDTSIYYRVPSTGCPRCPCRRSGGTPPTLGRPTPPRGVDAARSTP